MPEKYQPEPPNRSNKPLIIIGGIVVLVAAGILYVTKIMEPHHAGPERQNPIESTPPTASTAFRDDALVRISTPDGKAKGDFSVEIAATEASRTQGLMGRTSMRQDQGMLFLFENAEERAFWMANTPLPLDIIFMNEKKEIIRIHRSATPYSEESLPSGSPAKYVLEINGGVCERQGILEGDRIDWWKK